jgi:hypothetical protein
LEVNVISNSDVVRVFSVDDLTILEVAMDKLIMELKDEIESSSDAVQSAKALSILARAMETLEKLG